MTPTRRSFFAVLFAPLLTRLAPKAEGKPGYYDATVWGGPHCSGVAIVARQRQEEIQAHWAADVAFLAGEQWDPAVRASREAAGRPCLVFNKVLLLTSQQADKRRIQGQPLSDEEFYLLGVDNVRRHRDKQVLYNYLRTAQVEMYRADRPLREVDITICLSLEEQARDIAAEIA